MGTAGRSELLTELARQQSAQGYHLAYPVFYPIHPSRHAFDSTKDNILLVTIRALMARFN
jgi:membrane-anchored protein YejM (alkaline phosphatase superfamily)